MKVRVIQWNVKINCNAHSIAKQLSQVVTGKTLVHIQEVCSATNERLISQLDPDGWGFSLNLRAPGENEGKNRRMGVTTMVFGGEMAEHHLVNRSVFPERTLVSVANFDGKLVHSLNFHSLTGVDYKKAKSSNFASIADQIIESNLDFFACDANEPKVDSLDSNSVEFFDNRDKGRCAGLIFGIAPVHNLHDALKTKLRNQGIQHCDSPLAVSHIVGGKPRRYDHIYHAGEWSVTDISYDFESAVRATSDHAIVVADFASK